MEKFVALILYILWTLTLIGVLIITFTSFQYLDLNIIVIFLALFTLINTYFSLRQKR
jgi:hypothetical protein